MFRRHKFKTIIHLSFQELGMVQLGFILFASSIGLGSCLIPNLPMIPPVSLLVGTAPGVAFTLSSMAVATGDFNTMWIVKLLTAIVTCISKGVLSMAHLMIPGVFSLAALAIAWEALLLANPPRGSEREDDVPTVAAYATNGGRGYYRRKRRSTIDELDLESMFQVIDASDGSECGKLLVCNAMAKSPTQLSHIESIILDLFPPGRTLARGTAYGKYQWAAVAGSFKNPAICLQRYASCPIPVQTLANYIRISHWGSFIHGNYLFVIMMSIYSSKYTPWRQKIWHEKKITRIRQQLFFAFGWISSACLLLMMMSDWYAQHHTP